VNSLSTYNHALPALTAEEFAADQIIAGLSHGGFSAFRVGGCVRDRLLGRLAHDVDVATDAPPGAVRKLFPNTYSVGENFGVVIVHHGNGHDIEVATFRQESGYADGRHPDTVHFSDAATDAWRRDFTINALFYDPQRQCIVDYVGGMADLRRGRICAIGNADARFQEDYLRMLRAVRFAAELDFELDAATAAAIQARAENVAALSAERLYSELTRMLRGRNPAAAMRLLDKLQLLSPLLPEVAALQGVEQPPQFHPEGDVWEHTLLMLSLLRAPSEVLAWATLLHDVGKPPTGCFERGRWRFPRHAAIGAEMTERILRRFKAARKVFENAAVCVHQHMSFIDVHKMRPATLRRMLARPGFADELELHRLDCLGSHGKLDNYLFCLDTLAQLQNQPELPQPLLSGKDLMALGINPGPQIGQLLREVQDQQLDGHLHSREQALHYIQQRLA